MNTTDAILAALLALFPGQGPTLVASVSARVEADHVRVLAVLPRPASERGPAQGVWVRIDRRTRVAEPAQSASGAEVQQLLPPVAREEVAGYIGAQQAHSLALRAVAGYEHLFNASGPMSIVLRGQHYEVTLPEAQPADSARSAGYAFIVWIDARTGAKLKIVVPS